MAIWVLKDTQREGPYEEQDVRELIYEGTYTDADPAIRDGQFDWSTLGQILGRRPQSAEPPPPPPPAPGPPSPALPETAESPPTPESRLPPAPAPAPAPALPGAAQQPIQVAVVDVRMPFGSMVVFMVKWVIASIPALLIVGGVVAVFWTFCAMLLAALLRH